MKKYQILVLKSLRKVYTTLFKIKKEEKPECIQNADVASNIIYDTLLADKPCMIARFGNTELSCLVNYLGVTEDKNKFLPYIKGKTQRWWWEDAIINQMQNWSGFFPSTQDKIEQFCRLMLKDIPQVDILGSWLAEEQLFEKKLLLAEKVHLRLLEPFWSDSPWTKALEGKKVIVVHPFAETIEQQYVKRQFLFSNKEVLPTFASFSVIKAVQTLGEGDTRFKDWFEALDFMKSEIDKLDYDVCLIGCGAYGFHLAAHVKRSGKKGIHLGGALQLLFGIKGKRWEDPNYGVKEWGIPYASYSDLMNEYWLRPDEKYKPKNAEKVEGACYW
jgi:hypothetical protein